MSVTLARRIALATVVLAAPTLVRAQAAPELRPGRWAAEADFGPLLPRIHSPVPMPGTGPNVPALQRAGVMRR